MRTSHHKLPKNRNTNGGSGGSHLIGAGLFLLLLLYGGITIHILNRGELSRDHDFNRSSIFPRGKEGNLETHPDLQHHDLSSIFLEGLPPLRTTKLVNRIESDHLDVIKFDRNTLATSGKRKSKIDDFQDRAKFLRGRMPID